jgi:hypothetical protein
VPEAAAGADVVLARFWGELTRTDGDPALAAVRIEGDPDRTLPCVYRVGTLAAATVATGTLAAAVFGAERTRGWGAGPPAVRVDVRAAVASFRSERYLRLDGRVGRVWEPLSGDYRTADGWIRLHGNFPHHAEAACRALGARPEPESVAAALRSWAAADAEQAVAEAGGAAGALRTSAEWAAHPQSAAIADRPLVRLRRTDEAADPVGSGGSVGSGRSGGGGRSGRAGRPLAGLRVLDLTRVIAGPVAGRVLTSWGADVLAVRAPHLPTHGWLDLDTGFGKRLRLLDLRTADDRDAFLDLVRRADVVLQSYRPGALDRLGLGAAELAAVRPGLGYVSVSAYGDTGPWAGRRGFDSLVQLVTGLADEGMRAAGVDRPVPLPAQALDHGAGWLAAAAAVETVRRARRDGGSWQADVTLAGVAHRLAGLGRVDATAAGAVPEPTLDDVADLLASMRTPAGELRHVRPPGTVDEVAPMWESPTPFPGVSARTGGGAAGGRRRPR